MNRKVISLLAILAMLVSMLTCIVVPSSAADTTTETTEESTSAYTQKQLVKALYDAINWSGNTTLKTAVQNAYKLGTDAGYADAITLIDAGLGGKDGDGNTLTVALSWLDFNGEDVPYPRYLFHDAFIDRGYTQDKWSISATTDWEAMREVADSVNATLGSAGADAPTDENGEYVDYFVGTEFHLTKDIEFVCNEATEPMGFSIYKEGGGFAGTINGHGYGFNNIYIQNTKAAYWQIDENGDYIYEEDGKTHKLYEDNVCLYAGLFYRLADCTFIDFGINSGLIYQSSGSNDYCVSTFGTVISGKTPTFKRVWSSAIVAPICNARATALVGSFDAAHIDVNLNGFVFDGTIVKGKSVSHSGQISYGIYSVGGDFIADGNDFYNIITDFRSCNGTVSVKSTGYTITSDSEAAYSRGGKAALFNFGSVAAFEASKIKNVYAVKRESEGIDEGYTLGISSNWGGSGSEDLLTDMTAREVARIINDNPTSLAKDGAEPVYFKVNNEGKIRPFAKEDYGDSVVRLTLTGAINEKIYVDRNVAYDFAVINKTTGQTFAEVDGFTTDTDVTQFTLTKTVTVEVTDSCTHSELTNTQTGEEHTGTCSCGYTITEACTSNGTYTFDENIADAATHNTTCAKCNNPFTQNCAFTLQDGAYVCACGRTADAPAVMDAGDANGNGTIDLADAIQVLKKAVGKTATINERNADVDGDNEPGINDVRKIILHYLGDKKIQEEFDAIEARVNAGNLYDLETVSVGNLKMDGTESDNDRYVVTENIAVSKGNEIVFGPVREAQAVMGHFYDEDGNAIELINHLDIEAEYTFAEGMIMASVIAPEGAATVRLQANAKEKDQFYIRINNDFSVADYQYQTGAAADTLENPLSDQLFLTVGDSLCAAATEKRDSQPDGILRGWARRIYQQYDAKVINSSEGGSAVSTVKFHNNETGETLSTRQCIVNQLNEHTDIGREFEYILLEGAGNDAANANEKYGLVGTFHPTSFNPAHFDDETTYAGGLERLIYTAIKEHGDTAAIGYMSYYAMPYAANEGIRETGKYFEVGKAICEKWGIEYLNLYDILTEDIFNSKSTANDETAHTHDGIHANDTGYDIMQGYIGPFTQTMRPISQEVYLEVQKYAPIDKVIGQ